jgi:GLPGLI family protein
MKIVFIYFFFLLMTLRSAAQDVMITKGKIEYEKKVNLHKEIEADAEGDDNWFLEIKKSIPQNVSLYFDLYFENGKTLYKPGREVVGAQRTPDWIMGPAIDNIVFHDLDKQQDISLKKVFESNFLVQDSVRKIKWQITFDKRTIAGFECRKAVAIIMDSIYVVAFYTDEIATSGGPESFSGLPGMILGIAIPRINTTWFATKLELVSVKPEDITPPKKGKKVSNKELMAQLQTAMKDWGKFGKRNIWHVML